MWFALCGHAVSLQEACLLPSTLMAVGSVVVDTRHLNYAYRDTFTTVPSAPRVELTLVLLSSCYLYYTPKYGDRKPILRTWLHLAEETTKKCMQPNPVDRWQTGLEDSPLSTRRTSKASGLQQFRRAKCH